MSIGISGFSTGQMFALQANPGTLATTGFMLLPAEDSSGLTPGQVYIDRNPAYGLRTQASGMHTRDHTMPGGDLASWAVGIDGTSLALLHNLRMFFQNYSIANSATGIGSHAWTFTPRAQNGTALDAYDLYTVVNITGLAGDRNEHYRDCISMKMAGAWSPGSPLSIKQTIQSMDITQDGTPAGWGGAATELKVMNASSLCFTAEVDGSSYTLYPSSFGFDWDMNAEDIVGACTSSGRARMTPGNFTGNSTLTLPRNNDMYALAETNGDVAGTLTVRLRPSGNYTTGSLGTYTGDIKMYGKYMRPDKPSGPGGDITGDLEFHVQDVSWLQYSDVGSSIL